MVRAGIYLVSDLDKEDEDDDNKQVADDADRSDDGVDDIFSRVSGVDAVVIFRQGCRGVVRDIT